MPDDTRATSFHEVQKLTASDAEANDFFGDSVALSGDLAVVGAWGEDSDGSTAGAAYIFQRNQGGPDNWGQVTKLTASDAQAQDDFGWSVAVDGDTVVAGANYESASGAGSGAVYVFQRHHGGADNWGEVTKLTASDAQAFDRFGDSVALHGDTIVAGAWQKDAGASSAGAAYLLQRDRSGADIWSEVAKLTASDAQADDRFGESVAVSLDGILAGAFWEDSNGSNAGAAYMFDLPSINSKSTRTPTPFVEGTPTPTSTPGPNVSTGDANCDLFVNAIDAAVVLQFDAGLLSSLPCAAGGDANGDGAVTSIDAALILQFTAGLIGPDAPRPGIERPLFRGASLYDWARLAYPDPFRAVRLWAKGVNRSRIGREEGEGQDDAGLSRPPCPMALRTGMADGATGSRRRRPSPSEHRSEADHVDVAETSQTCQGLHVQPDQLRVGNPNQTPPRARPRMAVPPRRLGLA